MALQRILCHLGSRTETSLLGVLNAAPSMTQVRFRKPRWAPKAKSKLFYVRKEKTIYPGEYEDLKLWYSRYNTGLRALRCYLYDTVGKTIGKTVDRSEEIEEEAKEHRQMLLLNEQWNKQIHVQREARELEQRAAAEQLSLQRFDQLDQQISAAAQQADEIVLQQTELSETFITEDKLDEALEEALQSRYDFNFAVDLEGKIFKGGDAVDDQSPIITKLEKLDVASNNTV